MRVLVVDDDADIAAMLGRIVSALGHQAEACSDPTEAIEQHAFRHYDIVLSDFMMNPNGIEVLRAFEHTNCYRVLITASYGTCEISAALLSGVVHAVLTKPAVLSDLRRVLAAAASR